MKQYLEILEEILEKGTWKDPARKNMPRTLDVFSVEKRFDLQKGFPLVTTKEVNWRSILTELIWFLKGDTNIKYLVDNNVNIWNKDAYKYYLRFANLNGDYHQKRILYQNTDGSYRVMSRVEFINAIKSNNSILPTYKGYRLGDLGKVYGHQWRKWGSYYDILSLYYPGVDQIQKVIDGIKQNPESRYHIVTAWNPSEIFQAALPPCHMMFMFNCRKMYAPQREDYFAKIHNFSEEDRGMMNPNATDEDVNKAYDEAGIPKYYLDCKMIQRSCDTFLGVPYNIASYAFLTNIMAKLVNMIPGEFIWSGNSVHLYENHMAQVNLQLSRTPLELPHLVILKDKWESIDEIKVEDFDMVGYNHHPAIKAPLSVGLPEDQE